MEVGSCSGRSEETPAARDGGCSLDFPVRSRIAGTVIAHGLAVPAQTYQFG
jgi:hypothetical protein